MLDRLKQLVDIKWNIIIDEAQAIKNSSTRQTREVKELSAQTRVALTGAAVKNQL